MDRNYKIFGTIVSIVLILLFLWKFSIVVTYILIAGVLSLMGSPLMHIFEKIKIGKRHFPRALSALITLLIMMIIVLGFISIFVPMVMHQAAVISNIDITSVGRDINLYFSKIQDFFMEYNMLKEKETLETLMISQLENFINFATFTNIFKNIIGFAGNVSIALFSVLFITFFFLKEEHLFYRTIIILTPVKQQDKTKAILFDSKRLLTRYFLGLMTEVISMMTLLSVGLMIFGVKNALLIGFLGGLMNIIPYLGPIIGVFIGSVLCLISYLGVGVYDGLLPDLLIILLVFSASNLIDNIVLQPWIYSNSVKAHPLEIFIVILLAGYMFGTVGMILAIPTYTVLRIIAKQFLSRYPIIEELTKRI